jgi:hypothetical protein
MFNPRLSGISNPSTEFIPNFLGGTVSANQLPARGGYPTTDGRDISISSDTFRLSE